MTELALYSALALALLILIYWLVRSRQDSDLYETDPGQIFAQGPCHHSCLGLAERLFDPSDYLWLRDELGFPQAAESLAAHRKQMVLNWLRALRSSFNEMARTPEAIEPEESGSGASRSWQSFWLTLRFHLLLSYALLVVRFFGPYHRLAPSLGWTRIFGEASSRTENLEIAGRRPIA